MRKISLQNKDTTYLDRNDKVLNIYNESILYLNENEANMTELIYLFTLIAYLRNPENYVEINGEIPTQKQLGKLFRCKERRTREIIKIFKDKEIIKVVKSGRGSMIYVNPYLIHIGENISLSTLQMFDETIFHAIIINSNNKISTHNESAMATKIKIYCKKKYKTTTEYKIFKNPKTGHYLPFDIYIHDGIFIEIHGEQHYSHTEYFYQNPEKFEYRKYLDKIKKEYAENIGAYLEIDLRKIKKLDDAIFLIDNFIANLRKG